MAEETSVSNTYPSHLDCPSCGSKGKRVKAITLKSLLKSESQARLLTSGYLFCGSKECTVVYFSENRLSIFTKDDLSVRVGVKETVGPRHVCYCFNHTIEGIDSEVQKTGKSTVIDDIKARMKEACWCETKSPMGSCCLATVGKYVKAAQAKFGTDEAAVSNVAIQEDCCENTIQNSMSEFADEAESSRSGKVQTFAMVGGMLSALVASACCWLPLLLIALGVSGVAVSATFEQYRPLFLAVTFGFLAVAFYFSYRPSNNNKEETCTGARASCCPSKTTNRWGMKSLNRVMLWVVTAVAVTFSLFPTYVGTFLGNEESLALHENYDTNALAIFGMTCEACAVTLKQALEKVDGVIAAEVSYERNEALVAVQRGELMPRKDVINAISIAGYSGTFKDLDTHTLSIEGMTCEACAKGLEKALMEIPGVTTVKVDYAGKTAVIIGDTTLSREALIRTVENTGYSVNQDAFR